MSVCAMCYLFQSSLDLHSLSPGNSGIGQAVTIVGPPGEVDALFVQVAEGLCHHLHGVVGQCRCVLGQDNRKRFKYSQPYPLKMQLNMLSCINSSDKSFNF